MVVQLGLGGSTEETVPTPSWKHFTAAETRGPNYVAIQINEADKWTAPWSHLNCHQRFVLPIAP